MKRVLFTLLMFATTPHAEALTCDAVKAGESVVLLPPTPPPEKMVNYTRVAKPGNDFSFRNLFSKAFWSGEVTKPYGLPPFNIDKETKAFVLTSGHTFTESAGGQMMVSCDFKVHVDVPGSPNGKDLLVRQSAWGDDKPSMKPILEAKATALYNARADEPAANSDPAVASASGFGAPSSGAIH